MIEEIACIVKGQVLRPSENRKLSALCLKPVRKLPDEFINLLLAGLEAGFVDSNETLMVSHTSPHAANIPTITAVDVPANAVPEIPAVFGGGGAFSTSVSSGLRCCPSHEQLGRNVEWNMGNKQPFHSADRSQGTSSEHIEERM